MLPRPSRRRWTAAGLLPAASVTALALALAAAPSAQAAPFLRGDSNEDGIVNISDPIHTLAFLFLGGPGPACMKAADSNDDGILNISDPIFTLAALFTGGATIPPPFPQPGEDPTPDDLPCGVVSPQPQGIVLGEELAGGEVSPDGRSIAVLSIRDSMVFITDPRGEVLAKVEVPGVLRAIEFTADSRLLLVGSIPARGAGGEGDGGGVASAEVRLLDARNGRPVATIATGAPGLDLLRAHPGGEALAYAVSRAPLQGLDGIVSILDLGGRRVVQSISVPPRPYALEFVLGGRGLALSSETGYVLVLDALRFGELRSFKGLGVATGLAPAGDRFLLVGNGDLGPGYHVLDLQNGEAFRGGLAGPAAAIAFDAESSRVWMLDPAQTVLRHEELDPRSGAPTGRKGGILLDAGEAPDLDPHFGGPNLAFAELDRRPVLLVPVVDERIGVVDVEKAELLGLSRLAGDVKRISTLANRSIAAVTAGSTLYVLSPRAFIVDRLAFDFRPIFEFDFFRRLTQDTCIGNVAVLIDDGQNSAATSLATDAGFSTGGARIFTSQTQNAVARFYQLMPDIFDYCVVFWSSDWWAQTVGGNPVNVQPETGAAFHVWTKNFTRGIGQVWTSTGGRWGNNAGNLTPALTTRRLQSRVNMNDLGDWGPGQAFVGRNGTAIFAQELGHRFIAFVDTSSAVMQIRRDNAHYSHFFNTGGSAVGGVGGNLITNLGNGQFRIDGQELTFPPLDEYLMGLIPASSVPATFRVTNPTNLPAGAPPFNVGDTFRGTAVNVTINDIINNEGARRPNDTLSQKVFTVGVALCVPTGGVWNSDLVELEAILREIRRFYANETGERAHLVTKTCPLMFSRENRSISIGNSPARMAIHPNSRRAYVPSLNGTTVSIVDTDRASASFNNVVQTITVVGMDEEGLRPLAAALNAAGSRLYVVLQNTGGIANGRVKVYNTTNNAFVATITTGSDPRAIAVSRSGPFNRAYVLNRGSNTITVINTDNNTVATTWNTSISTPRDIAITDDGLVVVWTNEGGSTVASRHVVSGTIITATLPDVPFKLALVQNESVVNNTSARALSSDTPPALIYVTSNAAGRVYPMDLRTVSALGTHTFSRLRTNPDGTTGAFVPAITTQSNPQGITFLNNGAVALVAHRTSPARVSIIETATHSVLDSISLTGSGAIDVAMTRDGDRAYAVCEISNTVVQLE
jgi:YVTN family beta-propeller protein